MIYSKDIETCNEFTQASADNLKRAAIFVLATIQQQLETVPVAVTDMTAQGSASRFAWKFKGAGLDYLDANSPQLYLDAMNCKRKPGNLLEVFLRVPGFGLVKAGFLCQIFAGIVGCIDTHNIKLYEIPLSALRYRYESQANTLQAKRDNYVSLCNGLGGAHVLWSRWCDYVAKLRSYNWSDGAEVSKFHVDVVTGIETGEIVDLFSNIDYEATFRQSEPESRNMAA